MNLLNLLATLIWGSLLAVLIIVLIYLAGIRKYWKVRGVEYVNPQLLFGNFSNVVVNKENFVFRIKHLYDTIKGPFGGIYLLTQPILMARDPQLIKQILVADENKFIGGEVLTNNLLTFRGVWKGPQKIIPPIFYDNIHRKEATVVYLKCVALQKHIERQILLNSIIDVQELLIRFATDMSASVVFSTEIDSFNNPHSPLSKVGQLLAKFSRIGQLRSILMMAVPSIAKYFDINAIDPELEKNFRKIVEQSLWSRDSGEVVKYDYMQVMAEIRSSGVLSDDGKWDINKSNDKNYKHLTIDELVATVFLFYTFVFHTVSSTVSFTLLELARNKQIQIMLQTEIDRVLEKDPEITTDLTSNMKYLDLVLNETLRKYPVMPLIVRSVGQTFKIPNSEIVLNKNQLVFIPIYAIHHDCKYYPNPDVFNPDRFTADEIGKRPPEIFFPFGNHNLPGLRVIHSILQSKMAIITICSEFDLDLAPPDYGSDHLSDNFNLRFTKRIKK